MDLDTTQVTELHNEAGHACLLPSFSGDGQHILFMKRVETKITGTQYTFIGDFFRKTKPIIGTQEHWQLFAMKADGTDLSPLTTGSADAYDASWDKNNNLYFIINMGGKSEVYRARINIIN